MLCDISVVGLTSSNQQVALTANAYSGFFQYFVEERMNICPKKMRSHTMPLEHKEQCLPSSSCSTISGEAHIDTAIFGSTIFELRILNSWLFQLSSLHDIIAGTTMADQFNMGIAQAFPKEQSVIVYRVSFEP
jgi:hypothetical protein